MCFYTVVFNGLIRAWFSPTGFQLNLVKIVTLCRFFVDTEQIHRIHPCRDCNYDTFASQLPNSYLGHPSIWCNSSITGIYSLLSVGVSRTIFTIQWCWKIQMFKNIFLANVSHIFIAIEKGPLLLVENDLDEKRVQMVC